MKEVVGDWGTFEVRQGKRPFFRASMETEDKDPRQRRAEGGRKPQGVLWGVWLKVSVTEVDSALEQTCFRSRVLWCWYWRQVVFVTVRAFSCTFMNADVALCIFA